MDHGNRGGLRRSEREWKWMDTLRVAFPEHDSPLPLRSAPRVCFCWLLESSCKEWRERDWEWRRSERKGGGGERCIESECVCVRERGASSVSVSKQRA
jgi:hypothetical protein